MSEQNAAQNPYAPPTAAVSDVTPAGQIEKSRRRARLGAATVDGLIGLGASLPALIANFAAMTRAAAQPDASPFAVYGVMFDGVAGKASILLLIAITVVTIVLVHRNGQTIGKKLVGIKVLRKNGERATLGRIFALRYLIPTIIAFVPLLGALFALVDHLFIFGAEKRCVHDMIADTIVVNA